MASHSNRSPSPLSSRPTNPNLRNSEISSATRGSFSCNNGSLVNKPSLLANPRRFGPFTPANSPSDFSRRSSVGEEGISSVLQHCDEKENEKDKNFRASKLKSAKISKNFMSPTISAASKFTPSPKKKILVERNDPVRTSISISDGKATFLSYINASQEMDSNFEQSQATNSSEFNVSDKKEAVLEGPALPKPPKTVTFSDFPSNSNPASELSESVITESDNNLKSESVLKNDVSCSLDSSSIAPLDADPSLPPYDPKTNYLSPRPQFLHYKPNPRAEILLQDVYLAEIMSERFSDNESTEESRNEDSDKEESVVNDSADMVLGLDEAMESLPVIQKENVVKKRENKRWGFSKLTFFSVLLMFLMGCVLSVSFTRPMSVDQFVFSDLRNYYQELNIDASFERLAVLVNEFSSDLSNYYQELNTSASTKTVFEWLSGHVNEFSVNTIDLISKLIIKTGDGKILVPLKFVNLTYQEKNIWDEGNFLMNNHVRKVFEEKIQVDVVEEDLDDVTNDFEEGVLEELDSDVTYEKEMVEFDEDELEEDEDTEIEVESFTEAYSDEKKVDSDSVMDDELESGNLESDKSPEDHQLTVILQDQEIEVEEVEAMAETTEFIEFEGDVSSSMEDSQSSLKSESATENPENKSGYYIIGASTFIVALLPAVAFLYQKKKNSSSANVVMQQTHPLMSKQEKTISQNWQREVEESCHSEMSSFNSAFYSKKEEIREETEAQSIEGGKQRRRYTKRESLASSTGSPSYGSFTTFERIPINYQGEDEIITPVRRSSRIRKQVVVTSP